MQINFAHLCDYALAAEGKLSILGIFDQIRPRKMPWSHPTLYIAFEIGLRAAELGTTIKTRIEIRDEDGNTLFGGDGEMRTEGQARIGEQPKARQVICINGLQFKRTGPHEIVIWLQGNVAHTLRFEVLPPPAPSENA